MIIIDDDGNLIKKEVSPVSFCTGYRASALVMQEGDFEDLASLVMRNPSAAYAVLLQLGGRIHGRSLPPSLLDQVEKL